MGSIRNYILFLNNTNYNDLIEKKILDMSIYCDKCFRLYHCVKKGKKNKLVYYRGINYNGMEDKRIFLDSFYILYIYCKNHKDVF